ncbi:ati2 chaperone [Shewanella sp. VB17]|uniref:ati2 chaperone n=1 Tax=Shewanella sp. VB17 TaxID=2739432 RepID=UPI0015673AEA|nr:ati2 chaperone [Shewanella sp. VB17]NRD73755.1 ati2 chaperone [Shewanella sp. VB17]
MDIYQQSLSFLGVDIKFNEYGIFSCELRSDKENEDDGILLTAIKNTLNLTLSVSISNHKELPNPMPDTLFLVFADQSLAPVYGGMGLGVLPDSRRLVAYQTLSLDKALDGAVQRMVEELTTEIEQWNEMIDKVNHTQDTSSHSTYHHFLKV